MGVVFKDNSKRILEQFEENKIKALTGIGLKAVEKTLDYMTHKYYKDIHLSGDLKRSIASNVRPNDDAVDVGSNLNYAEWVHNGTAKMKARPYLRDALLENTDVWKETAAEHLGEGIDIKVKI